jgi:hypothetical protein
LFSSGGSEAVIAAIATGAIGFPSPFYPAAFFKIVEHGIERSESETQGASGIFFNAPGDFKAVELLFIEQGKNREFWS